MTIKEEDEEEGKSEDDPNESVDDASFVSLGDASGLSDVSEIENVEPVNYGIGELHDHVA